jgi:hypothetical protein
MTTNVEPVNSLIEEEPSRAVANISTRIAKIIDATIRLAESRETESLLEAVRDQVGEELKLLDQVSRRLQS